MFWLRFSGWLFVVLATATAVVLALGSRLPAEHTSSREAVVRASPEKIWPLLRDAAAQPRWRSDVTSTELLPDANGLPCWTEHHQRSMTSVCVTQSSSPTELVLRTADPRQPVQMERRFSLVPDASGRNVTRVTVMEKVQIAPAMVRFYDHYLVGEQARVDLLLRDLDRAVQASPEPVSATPKAEIPIVTTQP